MNIEPVAVPTLPRAISEAVAQQPDTEMRIGRVVSYNAAEITVSVSGSAILQNAAYLFGQYQPALGDNVVLMRMGNQWIAVGAQSGNPTDNQVQNFSFETLPLSTPPVNWTLYHDPVSSEPSDVDAATVPVGWELDGSSAVRFTQDNTAPGSTVDYLSSEPIEVIEGQRWTASAWVVGESQSSGPCVRAQATLLLSWHANATDSYPTFISTSTIAFTNVTFGLPWVYLRAGGSSTGEVAPPAARYVRAVLFNNMQHNSCVIDLAYSVYWDRVITRQIL
jgi:hypothetical protein